MITSRLKIFPLFRNLFVRTTGTALEKSFMNLDVPGIRGLLPQAEALFLITYTDGLPAADVMEWNVSCSSGFDTKYEPLPSFDISATHFDLDGAMRSADYTTLTSFMLESRLQLWWRNAAAVSGVKKAEIGAALGVRLYGA